MPIIPPRLQRPFAQFDLEDFEMVARLDVVRIRQPDTALQARAHFGDIVLEAAERGDRRRRDDDVLTSETRVEALADRTFQHPQARPLPPLASRARLLHPGPPLSRPTPFPP